MIRALEIRQVAITKKIKPEIIEKDYVLGWVIAALHNQIITSKWIFKGGTALKKCYFHEYRFSEDLDYSIINPDDLSETTLLHVLNDITDWIYSKSGIELLAKRQKIERLESQQDNRISSQVRIYYQGPISPHSPQQAPRIKLDLTAGECITDSPVTTQIYHPYSDVIAFNPRTLCYSFNEIFAEKLRAFIERCRPRDIYDIVHCFEDKRANLKEVAQMFQQKCEAKNIQPININTLSAQVMSASHFWEEQLAHQIQQLKSFDDYAKKSIDIIKYILT